MTIEILNRYTGAVMFASETADNIAAALIEAARNRANLYEANLSRANLYGADLSGANLYEANLYGADLSRAKTEGATIPAWRLVIPASRHVITAYPDRVLIGCQSRTINAWLRLYVEIGRREGYDDAAIEEYGGKLRMIKAFMDAHLERVAAK